MDASNRKISSIQFHNSTRYFIMTLSIVALSFLVSNSMALNFTIICMTGEEDGENVTDSNFVYSPAEQGWLFSIVAVGQILGTIIMPYSISHFQVRTTFTVYGFISALATLLTPLCAYLGFLPLMLMRLFQGFATSTSFTGMGSITSQWASIKESGMFLALLSCHLQLGNIFTMPVAGALCESSLGWPALYYLQGVLTVLCFIAFYVCYRDDPYWHMFVSDKELSKIERGKISVASRDPTTATKSHRQTTKVPYRAIFSDKIIWGIVIGVIGIQLGYFLLVQFGPLYMNKILKFDIKSTGYGTALPHIASILVKIIAGPLSDHLSCVSTKTNIKIFQTIANLLLIFGTLSLVFITYEYPILAQIAFVIVISFCGINSVGGMKAAQLTSQQYTHIIMVMITLITSVEILVLPIVIAILAPDNTHSQWQTIFIAVSIIVLFCMCVFNIMAEVEPRPWVKNSSSTSKIHQVPVNKYEVEEKR